VGDRHRLLILAATIALLVTLTVGLASCDTPSTIRFPTLIPDSRPFGIVSGPDSNLWFAENQAGQIGRITPQGDIIEIPIPTRNAFQMGNTTGPDGALWYTEQNGNAIGRLDPARVK
jgi:streptogramin lyase